MVLSESPGKGKWCSIDTYRLNLGASVGTEVFQQMFQDIKSLAGTNQLPTDCCDAAGSQEISRVRPLVFIKLEQFKIWLCKEGLCTHRACKEKMASFLGPHNSVCLRICQEADLNRAGLSGVGRVGLAYFP